MIAIVDYGLGNVKAFLNVYERLNVEAAIIKKSEDLKHASKIILPGVGTFDYAMDKLNKSGMRDVLDELILFKKVPVLGICVGMQILAKSSEEGLASGLGYVDACVKKLEVTRLKHKTKLPHMGWNTINVVRDDYILRKLKNEAVFYFLHSYYLHCTNSENILCETEYGMKFTSAIRYKNIYGVQFHPEKSHANGIQLLINFAGINIC